MEKYQGVLGRIVDGKNGVILVEDIKKEFILSKNELSQGTKEGFWLNIEVKDDSIIGKKINERLKSDRDSLIKQKWTD